MSIIIKLLMFIIPGIIINYFSKNKKDKNINANINIPKYFWTFLGIALIIISIGIAGSLWKRGTANINLKSEIKQLEQVIQNYDE